MAGASQHADVGAGAEHAVLARAQHDDANLRVLEAQPLHDIGQLDVDAEVIGVELELVALEQAGVLVHVEQEVSARPGHRELPVPVACGIALKVDARGHARYSGSDRVGLSLCGST